MWVRAPEVTFTLPVAEVAGEGAAAGLAPAGRPAPRDGPEQIPVLVVDDDPKTLRYVRDALAGSDYRPLVTGDPEELSGLIQTERPRLVLLDLMLPGTDGIELMERVPELADLPVIFISGYGRDETIARGAGGGRRRLHRQAALADGAEGADPGRPAPTRRARALPAG